MPGMPSGITVALASIAETMREGLLAFTTAAGLAVFRTLLDEELASKIGPKHVKNPDRTGNWHGTTTGQVVLWPQDHRRAAPWPSRRWWR